MPDHEPPVVGQIRVRRTTLIRVASQPAPPRVVHIHRAPTLWEELVALSWIFRPFGTLGLLLLRSGPAARNTCAVLGAFALSAVYLLSPDESVSLAGNFRATVTYIAGNFGGLAAFVAGLAIGWIAIPLAGLLLVTGAFVAMLVTVLAIALLVLTIVYSSVAYLAGWPIPFR